MSASDTEASGRAIVVGLVVLAVLFVAYLLLGMPGMEHSGGETPEMDHPSTQSTNEGP